MKHIFLKSVAFVAMVAGLSSCSDELNLSSIDPQSEASVTDEMQFLAKCYATLGTTGQTGPTGNGDLSLDEGESGFYRTTFNCEELASDEVLWAWQTDAGIPAFTAMSWDASTTRVKWCYTRLGYDITLYNQYLETATSDEYKPEVRFLRALHYWYFLDLFGGGPFKTDADLNQAPVYKGGAELYAWLDEELTNLESELQPIGTFNNAEGFGRVDQGAAYLLHARLFLNASVYTNGAVKAYDKALEKANVLINSGKYSLCTQEKNGYSGYEQLFMADNDENTGAMNEIILPIRQDGDKTQCYSAANYLVSSMRIAGMPMMGTTNGWSCNFSRGALVEKFFPTITDCPISTEAAASDATEEDIMKLDAADGSDTKSIQSKAGDKRALFYGGRGGGVRKLKTDKITNFLDGMSIVKWNNYRADGGAVHGTEFPDVDIPLLRFAEAYMIQTECLYRQGSTDEALAVLNSKIRTRAGASALTYLDDRTLCDEWCREFYTEGRRRSDLRRFGYWTSNSYLWDWKGGVENGTTRSSKYELYPIPLTDLQNNANLQGHQNPGYDDVK